MGTTSIQWTDFTWNPMRGCDVISPGCHNCYAKAIGARFSGPGLAYEGLAKRTEHGPQWTGEVRLILKHLGDPLRMKAPKRIFVTSVSDPFHDGYTNEEIAAVFGVMAACPQHTFQLLTKRLERAEKWFRWAESGGCAFIRCWNAAVELGVTPERKWFGTPDSATPRPLPNVHLIASTEDQRRLDERMPLLLRCPAVVRGISAEPLLGPLDLHLPTRIWGRMSDGRPGCDHCCNGDRCDDPTHSERRNCRVCRGTGDATSLDWIIVGGESGNKARPFDLAWARSILAQCKAGSVPVFVKQLGARPFQTDESLLDDEGDGAIDVCPIRLNDGHGGDWDEWPEDLRVRQFPRSVPNV